MNEKLRGIYADQLEKSHVIKLERDLNDGDRFDLASEIALFRESIANLLALETETRKKHPNRPDLLIAFHERRAELLQQFIKTTKFAKDVELAGLTWTAEKVAALVDKIISLIVYHIGENPRLIEDINVLTSSFRKTQEQGTLLTPDQDAIIMDSTIPLMPSDN